MGKKISDYIRLFPKDQTFTSDPTVLNLSNKIGICILDGIISAKISEEINGAYEATIEYDMDNQWFKEIKKDMLLVMRVDPYESKPVQIFRIYSISRNLTGSTATIIAKHISYDLSNYILLELDTEYRQLDGTNGLLSKITSGVHDQWFNDSPFGISTTPFDDRYIEFGISEPRSIRNIIGDGENSILEKYGKVSEIDNIDAGRNDTLDNLKQAWLDYLEHGATENDINYEIEYNNFNVIIHTKGRGVSSGVRIQYGTNLTDYSDESKNDEMYTHVFPFFITTTDEDAPEATVDGSVEKFTDLPQGFDLAPHYVKLYDVWKITKNEDNTDITDEKDRYYVAMRNSLSPGSNIIEWVKRASLEPEGTEPSLGQLMLPYSFLHMPKDGSTANTQVKPYDIRKIKISSNNDEDVFGWYKANYKTDENGKVIPNTKIIEWQSVDDDSKNTKTIYMDIIHNPDGSIMWGTRKDMLIPTRTDSPDPDTENAYIRTLPYDCTSDWQNEYKYTNKEIPSNYEIMKLGQKYIKNNNLTDKAKVSMKVSFEQVMDDPEMVELFETVHLGDYINVYIAKLGVNREAEVVKTEYDVLTNRYTSIEIGEKFKDLTSRMIR